MNQFAEAEVSHLINDLSMFKTTNANISSGAFRVDKGIINYTEQFVAMKRAQTEDAYNSLINEFKVLCKISNVTVQSLVGFYPNDDHKKAVLITPFYKNGNLRNVINTQPSEWTLDTKIIVFLGVSYGLKYLHENDIIHHDLTVDNIFIDDNFHPIIGGFGLTHKSIEPDSVSKARYLAPEIINGEKYTKKTDVYTFGLLMNEVFSSKQPYEGLNIQRIKENINNGVLPEISGTTPPVFVSLIKKCLSKDPKKRCKSKKLFNKIRSIYDEISGINRSILDNYKNQIIYSELFPFNNFVIPTPLTDIKSNPHPWDKTSKYPILIKNFESTLRKAGNRPIVLVMLFGPYQSGKSTYLKTLTGNGAFYAGKGTKSQTQGILIDGPYIISDIINRFSKDYAKLKEKCDSINVDKNTAIFFIDSQGIGDEKYELKLKPILDKVNAVFTSISTVCLTISRFNDKVDDFKSTLTTIRRAQLSSSFPLSNVFFLVRDFKDLEQNLDQRNPDKYQDNFKNFSELWWKEHNIAKELYSPNSLKPLPLGDVEANLSGYINSVYQSFYFILNSIQSVQYFPDQFINSIQNESYPLFSNDFQNFMDLILKFEKEFILKIPNKPLADCVACTFLLNDLIGKKLKIDTDPSKIDELTDEVYKFICIVLETILPYILGNAEVKFCDYAQYVTEIKRDLKASIGINIQYMKSKIKQYQYFRANKWKLRMKYIAAATFIGVGFSFAGGVAAGIIAVAFESYISNALRLSDEQIKEIINNVKTPFYPYIWDICYNRKANELIIYQIIKKPITQNQTLIVFYEQPNHHSELLFQSLTGFQIKHNIEKQILFYENVYSIYLISRFKSVDSSLFIRNKKVTKLLEKISIIYMCGITQDEFWEFEKSQNVELIFVTTIKKDEQISIKPSILKKLNVMTLSTDYYQFSIVDKPNFKYEMWKTNKFSNENNQIKFLPIHAGDYQLENYGPRCIASIKYTCRYILKDPILKPTVEEIQEYEKIKLINKLISKKS